ncbi:hypothetical protein ABC345_19410 [Shouchella sp. 1P09AA]|uniref:hypothetical protein n=1 Tax=unclassified Shouchella TaxID=2893065 RepID=UPI00399FA68E
MARILYIVVEALKDTVFGGYRATNIPYGQLPTSFPESGELFRRDFYASPWLITG